MVGVLPISTSNGVAWMLSFQVALWVYCAIGNRLTQSFFSLLL
jgi:hypothetical protein